MARTLEKQAGPGSLGATKTITAGPAYTVLPTDKTLLVDDTRAGQAVRVVLPAVVNSKNREIRVKKIGANYSVTVDGNGANIDGSATHVLSSSYDSIIFVCDGTAWWIV